MIQEPMSTSFTNGVPFVRFWKVQMYLSTPTNAYGTAEAQLRSFLTAGQKTPYTRRICNWVGPTASLNFWWKLSYSWRESNTGLYRPTTPAVRTATTVYGKEVPLQAWSGPEGSRKLRFPDIMTTAQNGGKVVSLTHRPPLPPGNTPGIRFC